MSLVSHYSRIASTAFGYDPEDGGGNDGRGGDDGPGEEESLIHPATIFNDGEVAPAVARGDTLLDDDDEARLKSVLPDVDDDRWSQFARALISGGLSDVSPSNGVGLWSMMPRRLADLGIVSKLGRSRSDNGRTIWVAVFLPPMTCDRFLTSPRAQYQTFCKSIKKYDDQLSAGEISKDDDMSRSGALAILHRAGPRGLDTWRDGERFDGTRRAYERISGVF